MSRSKKKSMNAEYAYDHDVDILIIHLQKGTFDDGAEIAPGLVAAYDSDGNLLELELRNIRRISNADFDFRNAPHIYTTRKALNQSFFSTSNFT